MPLVIRVLSILAAIALMVILYYVTIWILGLLGIHIPPNILTAIFVFLGLLAAIAALTGQFDNFIKVRPPGP